MKADTLFIMAHPDDAAIFCGGSIINSVQKNKKCHILSLTSLANTTNKQNPMEISCNILGADFSCLDFKSTSQINYAEPRKSIIEKLLLHSPLKIVTHWEKDSHLGHILAFNLAKDAVTSVVIETNGTFPQELYCADTYWSWGYDRSIFQPSEFIDITSAWENKISAIKAFKDKWESTWLEMSELTNKLNGCRCGVRYAESFLKYSCFVTLKGSENAKNFLGA